MYGAAGRYEAAAVVDAVSKLPWSRRRPTGKSTRSRPDRPRLPSNFCLTAVCAEQAPFARQAAVYGIDAELISRAEPDRTAPLGHQVAADNFVEYTSAGSIS
jgi:hypothetical protein